MATFHSVAPVGVIKDGAAREFEVAGRRIGLTLTEGKYFAFQAACRHKGGPLCEGEIRGKTIECPWHAWEYDLETGVCSHDDHEILERYEVKIENGMIMVAIS